MKKSVSIFSPSLNLYSCSTSWKTARCRPSESNNVPSMSKSTAFSFVFAMVAVLPPASAPTVAVVSMAESMYCEQPSALEADAK